MGCGVTRACSISFIGRRPGEKLQEDLVGSDETVEPSPSAKILRVVTAAPPGAAGRLLDTVGELERAAAAGETEAVFMYRRRAGSDLFPVPSSSYACNSLK
jgi:FlaA1/EpsC-like NDP-sugar epimerase